MSVIQFRGLVKSSTWMWSEMGVQIAMVCALCLLLSSTWHEPQWPKLFKVCSKYREGFSASVPLVMFVSPTEMHRHSD